MWAGFIVERFEDTWWQVLGVCRDASLEEARQAYRDLAGRHHPDRWQDASERDRLEAESRMKKINEAFDSARKHAKPAPTAKSDPPRPAPTAEKPREPQPEPKRAPVEPVTPPQPTAKSDPPRPAPTAEKPREPQPERRNLSAWVAVAASFALIGLTGYLIGRSHTSNENSDSRSEPLPHLQPPDVPILPPTVATKNVPSAAEDTHVPRAVVAKAHASPSIPDDAKRTYILIAELIESGRNSEAVERLNRLIDEHPSYAKALSARAFLMLQANSFHRAIADCDAAIRIDNKLAYAYSNRGIARYRLDQHTAAIADFTKSLQLEPTNSLAFHFRGLAYDAIGQTEKAKDDKRVANALAPDQFPLATSLRSDRTFLPRPKPRSAFDR